MAKFEDVSAAHYYAPGHEPDRYTPIIDGLSESILTIGPAVILVLLVLLAFARVRDKVLDRSPDKLSQEALARQEAARVEKAREVRQSVQSLRKQRQQQTRTV